MTETTAPTDVAAILAARPEIGEKLRERAALVQFLEGAQQQMQSAVGELQYLNAFLEGAGVPADTPPPAPPEPEAPQRNRAEKRAARRKPVKKATKKRGPYKKSPKLSSVPPPE